MNKTTELSERDREALTLAADCARLLDERKMEDVKVFDVRNSLQIADCFIIATGLNPRHLRAASEHLLKHLRERGTLRRAVEGSRDCGWMLIDLDSVVVHLFLGESRRFYDLEILWGDSPLVDWPLIDSGQGGAAANVPGGDVPARDAESGVSGSGGSSEELSSRRFAADGS